MIISVGLDPRMRHPFAKRIPRIDAAFVLSVGRSVKRLETWMDISFSLMNVKDDEGDGTGEGKQKHV